MFMTLNHARSGGVGFGPLFFDCNDDADLYVLYIHICTHLPGKSLILHIHGARM